MTAWSDLHLAAGDTDRMAVPLAGDEVVFAGQPVAMVVAVSDDPSVYVTVTGNPAMLLLEKVIAT